MTLWLPRKIVRELQMLKKIHFDASVDLGLRELEAPTAITLGKSPPRAVLTRLT